MTKKAFVNTIFALFASLTASAKLRIPFGKVDKIEVVAELPDNEKYVGNRGSKDYLELATLHQEYNIAWVIPVWITKEPKLVLAQKDSDIYYEVTDDELSQILIENKLDKESLLQLGLYTRYGGKAVMVILIGLMIFALYLKITDDQDEDEVAPSKV